jgi:hypothetical protein
LTDYGFEFRFGVREVIQIFSCLLFSLFLFQLLSQRAASTISGKLLRNSSAMPMLKLLAALLFLQTHAVAAQVRQDKYAPLPEKVRQRQNCFLY